MNNYKILPFSDWFKVYEDAGRKFEKSQRILENMTANNLNRLFESVISQTSMTIPEGLKSLGGGNLRAGDESFGDPLPIDTEKHNQFISRASALFREIPNFYFATGDSPIKIQKITKQPQQLNIMKLILSGIGNNTGVENLAIKLMDDIALLDSMDLKISLVKTFSIATVKSVSADGKTTTVNIKDKYSDFNINNKGELAGGKNGTSRFNLCGYLNTVNIVNFAIGDGRQYVNLSKYENSEGMDIQTFDDEVFKESSGTVYLYSPSSEVETGSDTQQAGPAAPNGGAWINWKNLSSYSDEEGDVVGVDINQDLTKMTAAIIKNLEEKEVITKLQLTSTIGTNWQGVTVQPSSGTGKPSEKDQTDQTAAADKTELGNKWLAYLRGSVVAKDLYAELGPRIQPNSIEIIWKVAAVNSEKDNNISFNIIQKAPSAKPITDTNFVNKVNQKAAADGIKIQQYKLTFKTSSLVGAKKSSLNKATGGLIGKETVQYEDLQKGMKIKYKGKDDNGNVSDTIKLDGIVLSVDGDGIPTIKTPSGNKLELKKARFISGPKSTGESVEE
jgi:hypothetical protein